MGQYKKLLSVSRVPQDNMDTSVHAPIGSSKHVIVAHNNHLFPLDVYHGDENFPLSEGELIQQLQYIVYSSVQENNTPVGVLTSKLSMISTLLRPKRYILKK